MNVARGVRAFPAMANEAQRVDGRDRRARLPRVRRPDAAPQVGIPTPARYPSGVSGQLAAPGSSTGERSYTRPSAAAWRRTSSRKSTRPVSASTMLLHSASGRSVACSTSLADGFLKHGHEVMRGTRDPSKLSGWKHCAGARAQTGTFPDAVRFGELVVISVKGTAAGSVVEACQGELSGKVVVDTNNPIADAPPVNGVLRYFTGTNESLLETLQRKAPAARFVKAFSCVGSALMVNPDLPGGRPTMFICGNDAAAKQQVAQVLDLFGWEVEDMGAAEAARAIEPLCMLWCIPGLRQNRWTHAFKLLKK